MRAGRDRPGDRPGPGVRHRRPPDHPPVPGAAAGAGRAASAARCATWAAARACWRSPRPGSASGRSPRWTPTAWRSRPRAPNARDNGVALAAVERVDLRAEPPPAADVVVANLMRPLLLRVAELMRAAPPRALIVSGLLDEEADEVAAAFRAWRAAALERPGLDGGAARGVRARRPTTALPHRVCDTTPATSCHHGLRRARLRPGGCARGSSGRAGAAAGRPRRRRR